MTTTRGNKLTSAIKTVESLGSRHPKISHAMQRVGVSLAHLRYEGRFDLKIFDEPLFFTRKFKVSRRPVSDRICALLRAEFEKLLDQRYPHWERFEGARGEFIWDIKKDALTHQHDIRTTIHRTTQTEGFESYPSSVPVEIYPMLVVSTAHVSEPETRLLEEEGCGRCGYGWLIYAGDGFEDVLPKIERMSPGLKGVLRFAYQQKCMYVLFDQAAEELMDVPTYGWAKQ